MSKSNRLNLAVSAAAVILALAGSHARALEIDKERLYDHLRASYQLPADVQLALGAFQESEVPGMLKASLSLSKGAARQEDVVYVSNDGKYYVLGAFKDLSVHPDEERMKKIDLSSSHYLGPKDASVSIVEYTDFQCPFCKRGYEIMADKIMKEFTGKVKWYYKSLPLNSIHPWAEPAAVAAECAGRESNDKFWALHDAIFQNQGNIKTNNMDDKFAELAKGVGVDTGKFQACYDSKATLPKVQGDTQEAMKVGLRSTPSFLVNGRLIAGADYEGLKAAIEGALRTKKGVR